MTPLQEALARRNKMIAAAVREGVPRKVLADAYGLSDARISQIAISYGIRLNKPLTEEQCENISRARNAYLERRQREWQGPVIPAEVQVKRLKARVASLKAEIRALRAALAGLNPDF